jgi:hypothetical protein
LDYRSLVERGTAWPDLALERASGAHEPDPERAGYPGTMGSGNDWSEALVSLADMGMVENP